MSRGTRAYQELWSHAPRASRGQLLPPMNLSGSQFALSLGDCFRLSPPIGAHVDVYVLSHLHQRGSLLQVWCPVQFRRPDVTCDTYDCYPPRGGSVQYSLVHQPPSQVQYMLWFELCFNRGSWPVVLEAVSQLVVGKNYDPTIQQYWRCGIQSVV